MSFGGAEIKSTVLLCGLATLAALALPALADAPRTDCAKGPVAEIPESIRQTADEHTDIVWYADKSATDQLDEHAFYLYAGKKGCEVWLRLRVQYVSDKPDEIIRVQIKTDSKTFEFSEPRFERESDGKLTSYWLDEPVDADYLLMLFSIAAAKTAVIRFVGATHSDERALSEQEKAAVTAMLSTYRALGGEL